LSWSAGRISCLVEALALAVLVGAYIWYLQAAAPNSWVLLAAWPLVSFLVHRDTPKTLGWRADNLWPATQLALWFFVPAAILICFAGLFLGMLHRLPEHLLVQRRFFGYFSFCLLQQVALNSLLTNRLLTAFGDSTKAALVAGAIFAALHWPNPVLIPLTFLGGTAMAWLFAQQRNILALTLGQAVLGALVWWAFPLAWHHSMRVGPGFYAYHP
jgi:hypothetical protein